jgi:hypothetical protein
VDLFHELRVTLSDLVADVEEWIGRHEEAARGTTFHQNGGTRQEVPHPVPRLRETLERALQGRRYVRVYLAAVGNEGVVAV